MVVCCFQFASSFQEAADGTDAMSTPPAVVDPVLPASADGSSADSLFDEGIARRLFDSCVSSSKDGIMNAEAFVEAVQGNCSGI